MYNGSGVYQQNCKVCPPTYLGQTGRTFRTRYTHGPCTRIPVKHAFLLQRNLVHHIYLCKHIKYGEGRKE
jgi:hypothetical protein